MIEGLLLIKIATIIILFFVTGCSYKTRTEKKYHKNRMIWKVNHFRGLTKMGHQLTYFPNGQLSSKRIYKNGKLHSYQEGWHSNGKKRFKSQYYKNIKIGKKLDWHDNGQLAHEISFKGGKEFQVKAWRRSGQIYANFIIKNNRPYGLKGDKACFETLEGEVVTRN